MGNPLNAAVTYGETVKSKEVDAYYVEAQWPCTCSPTKERGERACSQCARGGEGRRWARYSPLAFNDRRNPNTGYDGYGRCRGTFEKENPDVAGKRLERDPYSGFLAESPVFADPADAIAYAVRLAAVGESASKYDNMTHIPGWRDRHSRAITTRVVHERSALVTKVVTGLKARKAA